MRKALAASFLLLLAPVTQGADIDAGKAKVAAVCAACHGPTGVSVSDSIPNLAAQRAGYLEAQLKALKEGTRKNPIMNAIAAQLSADEMANVAAYFAAQPGPDTGAKSAFLPNVVATRVSFPEGYKDTFTKYHAINFPATNQVRYYFANKVAVQAAKEGRTLPDGSVLFIEGLRGETRRRQEAGDGQRRSVRAGQAHFLLGDGSGRWLGQGLPGDAAQRGLELRRFHDREAAPDWSESGRVPCLPQAARQDELYVYVEAAGGSEIGGRGHRDIGCAFLYLPNRRSRRFPQDHAVRSGRRRCQSVARWYARPMAISVVSAKGAPINCTPTGSPPAENPAGNDSAHAPR